MFSQTAEQHVAVDVHTWGVGSPSGMNSQLSHQVTLHLFLLLWPVEEHVERIPQYTP